MISSIVGDESSASASSVSPCRLNSGAVELVFNEVAQTDEPAADVFGRLARHARRERSEWVGMIVFYGAGAYALARAAFETALGAPEWPVTWVETLDARVPVAGVQAFAVRGAELQRVRRGPDVVASAYIAGSTKLCFVGGLMPPDRTLADGEQFDAVFSAACETLREAGFEFGDILRTWFYNRDILAWYPDFNQRRTRRYAPIVWRSGALPASTGIGAANPGGAALSFSALAARPMDPASHSAMFAQPMASPKQGPAMAYGSSFSRAMAFSAAGTLRAYVSGTASIHADGASAHRCDAARQIELTMQVVAGILETRGLSFDDITRATAYYKDPTVAPHFAAWRQANGWKGAAVVDVVADVCRDELLFEIEVDAERRIAR